ncbi:protein kinase GIN4 NDAI_0A00660 [Naumovozyma dairenensis CBS 421]|uniref:non-specific serine/threonine protein kinase n=1 Tax=Naumovozyma dairenensis (strain ATCC 10597 / BCRC 20456 / CBS 421 / NBRC 0211 / NRRL Y-12639) TaxID=1071378 RepID=G0W336_NAUDC|nr:hypothetical protein NDAI_0A00660 [Naumovozyma dairenensis CBS 421]CCD22224.1 hypothetical protein NDAI_0A00660 [Naumovozyma dairenensis CBS 421]
MTSVVGETKMKGDTIGPWKLGKTLGLGSTGKVELAYNETTSQQAAIKIISKSIFSQGTVGESSMVSNSSPDALPYGIEREIIIMKLLRHPNVLSLYDVWETNSKLYMILEYAEKGELFNLLVERGPLPEKEAIRFFRQIIIGISYCHALGIVHRDLKPENLLLDHKLNIKIADFGMAALETKDKMLETSCGSPHYAAPEIVSGVPYHGFQSDVWSCGVILFALLTGRLPFDEEDGNIRNLLLKVQSGEYEMPDDDEISKEAQDLIGRILTVDPEQRIKTRDILKHPLLQKYPSIKDSRSIKNLPREDTYLYPLSENNSIIDDSILQNLVALWHGRDKDDIAGKLRESGADAEKTVYALLYRFKVEAEKMNTCSSPRRKNRISMISVSSSHKRPVSMKKISTVQNNTPPSNRRLSISLSSTQRKRMSGILQHTNSSPTPSRTKRISVINIDDSENKAPPPVPMEMLEDYKNNSKNVRRTIKKKKKKKNNYRLTLVNNKRVSITTKLLSTYAKLSEDDNWEYIERETKRTSSDFATLIDELFEHEKYERIRKEKEELERKVRETRVREQRREEEERAELQREQLKLQQKIDEEISKLKEDALEKDNFRSVSAPIKENEDEDENENELRNRRQFSLQTRPVSRLDPGILYSAPAEIPSYERVVVNESGNKSSAQQQRKILETIRRSKFLGSSFNIQQELEFSQRNVLVPTKEQVVDVDEVKLEGGLRKISEVKIPQFTRKSRHFSDSNKRLSVLSMYSTKQSYTNLGHILKDGTEESEPAKKTPELLFESGRDDRLYEVSEEPEIQEEKEDIETVTLPQLPPLKQSANTNANANETEINGLAIFRPKENIELEDITKEVKEVIPSQDHGKDKPIAINNPKQRLEVKPERQLDEIAPNKVGTTEKKRNVSFFRKFSNNSATIKGYDHEIYVNIGSRQLYTGLRKLLEGWTQYGLKDVRSDNTAMKITGKLANDNILSLRSTLFELLVEPKGSKYSLIGFTKVQGSSKVVRRLFTEIEKVLNKEGVL